MRNALRLALLAGAALLPAAALAQTPLVIEEPAIIVEEPYIVEEPLVVREPAVIVQEPVIMGGPIYEEDARYIAAMNGMVAIEDVDSRIWDGNFEVEGVDASGDDMEMTIDAETGAVIEIDD